MDNKNNLKDIICIFLFFFLILVICIFNFIIDPYYIFHNSTIKGINNVKPHLFSDKRQIIYSDLKINSKNKHIVFLGNCMISQGETNNSNIAFYTLPIVSIDEIEILVHKIKKTMPNINKIYIGLSFNELFNKDKETDELPNISEKIVIKDFTNLFFSWNTTKYSIQTLIFSIKNKNNSEEFIYPYREIAHKDFKSGYKDNIIQKIQDIITYANNNNIELIIYYSPVHITTKINIFQKGLWDVDNKFKKDLSKITSFYDYSYISKYNSTPLDENSKYFIDNIHITKEYNELILADLLSNNINIGKLVNEKNIDIHLHNDNLKLQNYMNENIEIVNKIKNIKIDDAKIKIKKSRAN